MAYLEDHPEMQPLQGDFMSAIIRNMKFITAEIDILSLTAVSEITTYSGKVLTAANLDTGTSYAVGKDYCVYELLDGSCVVSLSKTAPAGKTPEQVTKLGGFHFGKCRKVDASLRVLNASGAIRGSGWETQVFDGIVPRSIWTMTHRPTCDPSGMTYIGNGVWVDIYIGSDGGSNTIASAYNKAPLVSVTWYDVNERALASGKRLLTYAEWCKAAHGSPEGLAANNTNAWSATANTAANPTGLVANATSAIGCRDCAGNVYEWVDELITRAQHQIVADHGHGAANANGTGAWAYTTPSPFPGYGGIYEYYDYSLVALICGGYWAIGASCGPRTVICHYYPWNSGTTLGVRLACDSL